MNFLKSIITFCLLIQVQITFAQTESLKSYIFGHSLVTHTPGDQSIPHWFYLLSQEAGRDYFVDGQFGFLPTQVLPPIAQWGFDIVPGAWEGDFADSDYDNVIITAANFIQYQAPTDTFLGTTSVAASLVLYDYVEQEEPGIPFYIYENWPEFNTWPPSETQFQEYHDFTRGGFHDWWIELQDSTNNARPGASIKLIPVGYILSGLLTDISPLDTISPLTLYEDNSPHGEAVIYFLTALIHYAAIYEEMPPATFEVPNYLPDAIVDKYPEIITYIWDELLAFNYPNGDSRVFFNTPLPVELVSFSAFLEENQVNLFWETASEINNEKFEVEHSLDGTTFRKIDEVRGQSTSYANHQYVLSHNQPQGGINYYRLKQIDFNGEFEYSKIISVNVKQHENVPAEFYPNPSQSGKVKIAYTSARDQQIKLSVYDLAGKELKKATIKIKDGNNTLSFNFSFLGAGIYIAKFEGQNQSTYRKLIIQ